MVECMEGLLAARSHQEACPRPERDRPATPRAHRASLRTKSGLGARQRSAGVGRPDGGAIDRTSAMPGSSAARGTPPARGARMHRHLVLLSLLSVLCACAAELGPPIDDGHDTRDDGLGVDSRWRLPMDPTSWRAGFNIVNADAPGVGRCYGRPLAELTHAGEDWAGSTSTAIRAIGDGRVIYAALASYPGYVVVIEHTLRDAEARAIGAPLIYSMYGHLSALSVASGDVVAAGDELGGLWDQGWNTHLHWEVRTHGRSTLCGGSFPGPGYTAVGTDATDFGYLPPEETVRALAAAAPRAAILSSCGELARAVGMERPMCEAGGNRACGGVGSTTRDCDHCCDAALLSRAVSNASAALTCGGYAAVVGYREPACEASGNRACRGAGVDTSDCDACCDRAAIRARGVVPASETVSCGRWASAMGYAAAACERGGNGACGGRGPSTYDCDHCCDGAAPDRGAALLASSDFSCGDWARHAGYRDPACERGGNRACGGRGPRTNDCARCCDRAAR
jgi:murein DD-endopeptidase MepM/ murein hydrolase activator NlpD